MAPLDLTASWQIPAADLSVRYVRSSGPGGQNVNKVSTKAELRFALESTEALSDGQKTRLRSMYPSAVTQAGEFLLTGDEHRSQQMNLDATRERLKTMILSARRPPAIRRATKPSRSAKRRRLADKRHRSDVKKQRQAPSD